MDAAAWNDKYIEFGEDLLWSSTPNIFVASELVDLPAGRALELACGEGRNALWLAERGWRVTGVDFSDVALDRARHAASERGLDVEWVCADVLSWRSPGPFFDLVVWTYLQLPSDERRGALGTAVSALAPGGTVLVIAHDVRNIAEGTGGPKNPLVHYTPAEVAGDLLAAGAGDIEVLRAETVTREVEDADRPALDCLVRAHRRRSQQQPPESPGHRLSG